MNENLPINPGDFADFGEAPVIETTPFLTLDTGKGEDSLPGKLRFESLAFKSVQAAFIHATEYRRVFEAPYSVDKDAPIACASWDGKHAFGMGDQTPVVMEKLCERSCDGCEANRTFTCKPCFAILLAFRGVPASGGSQTGWQVGIYRASGLQVKSARAAWGKVSVHAESFRYKQGDKEIKLPPWCFGLEMRGQQRTSRGGFSGWEPVFDAPSTLDGESIKELAPLMTKGGKAKELWTRFMAQAEADARAIGQERGEEHGPAGGSKDLDDDVPF